MKVNLLASGFLAVLAAALLSGSAVNAEGVKGSIKVKRGGKAAYSKLVKISIADTVREIKAKYPKSSIKCVRLEEEDGYLVYETLFLEGGKVTEANVDAGSGRILKAEAGEDGENDREIGEKNEGNEEQAGEKEEAGEKNESQVKASISLKDVKENAIYGLAGISLDKAVEAAAAAFPGKAVKAGLENENDSLVYGVEIVSAGGKTADVKVDAGNGKVLAVEKDGDGENDEKAEGKDGEKDEQGEHKD